MEFRLNKIDTELRDRIKETTSSGKIHKKIEISVKNEDHNKKAFYEELKKQKKKKNKKFIVKAIKVDNVEIPVYKEEDDNMSSEETRGHIIDVRK